MFLLALNILSLAAIAMLFVLILAIIWGRSTRVVNIVLCIGIPIWATQLTLNVIANLTGQ